MDFSHASGTGHIILYGVSFFVLTNILIILMFNRSTAIINLVLFFTYSLMLYFKIFEKGGAKQAIIWGFYLLVLSLAHIIFSVIYLVVQFIRSNRKQEPR